MAKFFSFFLAQNVAFMVIKMTDTINLTVSTQKSVRKTMQTDPRYIPIFFLTLWAKPNRQPETDFNQYLGQYWVLLQTDSCVETVRSCRWFWVPWKLHSKQEKKDKIWLLLSKIVLKKWIWGKNWADGAKQVFIWVSVSPKYVESVEISHLPANFFYFVMQCYHRNPPHHL